MRTSPSVAKRSTDLPCTGLFAVLAFADMHWADATSLQLLKYCLPVCDHEPLLWLGVFRPNRGTPVWEFQHFAETEYPHRMTSLALNPLNEEESCELINRLIGPDVLPQETQELIIEKAEGVPYYLGEFIRSLTREGALVWDEGKNGWRATRAVASLELPSDSVTGTDWEDLENAKPPWTWTKPAISRTASARTSVTAAPSLNVSDPTGKELAPKLTQLPSSAVVFTSTKT